MDKKTEAAAEIEHRPATDSGAFDGSEPEGWWFRNPGGAWVGPWVDRETAVEQARISDIRVLPEPITGKKIQVEVQIQGYNDWQPGVAVGRRGKHLLIQYRTVSGREPRERWFAPRRYRMADILKGFVPTLTQYKRETTKATTFPEPVRGDRNSEEYEALWRNKKCPRCGARIYPQTGEAIKGDDGRTTWPAIGLKSHSHIVNATTGEVWS